MDEIINYLNNDKLFIGVALIFINVGAKYVNNDLPKNLDLLFKNIWLRRLVIFFIIFTAMRDIKLSLFITLVYIFLFNILLHEDSHVCIIPKEYIEMHHKVTEQEVKKAKEIIEKYTEQHKK